MKDSKGRIYDGWVLKRDGQLLAWTFKRTRSEIRRRYNYYWAEKLPLTKVRIEVVE